MTPKEIAAFFAGYRRAFDNQDAAAIAAHYAEDCVIEDPLGGTTVGRPSVQNLHRMTFAAFPDFKIESEDLLNIGNRVVQTAAVRGTDTGGFFGLPPTGKQFRVPCIFLFTLKNRQIVHERRSFDFTGALLQLAGGMESAMGGAKLHRDMLERAQMEHDVKVAAEIQRTLAPQPRYCNDAFEVAATSIPCRAIGGDFFDYFDLDGGAFGLVLGDVSGKGPPAALLAAMVLGIFAVQAFSGDSPAEALANVNRALMRRPIGSRFATVFHAVISSTGRFTYCNAGHNPPALLSRSGMRRLESGGLILGAFNDATFTQETLQLFPGDVLVAFTDGATEALNSSGDFFDDHRLLACIQEARVLDPPAILEHLLKTIREFTRDAPQADDITALVLRYSGV